MKMLRRKVALLVLLSVSCALLSPFFLRVASGAIPAPSPRVIKPFDSDWRFYRGEIGGAEKTEFDDSAWRKLDVPHDWSIEGPFDENNATRGARGPSNVKLAPILILLIL